MKNKEIDLVIVGADRVTKNGDFANKIGTYEKAVLAKENGIPFYVAVPLSSYDSRLKDGMQIVIEECGRKELSEINGKTIMSDWISIKNPGFDGIPHK